MGGGDCCRDKAECRRVYSKQTLLVICKSHSQCQSGVCSESASFAGFSSGSGSGFNWNCNHNSWPSSSLSFPSTSAAAAPTPHSHSHRRLRGIAFSYFPMGKIHLALPQYLHIIVGSTNELASVRAAHWVCECVRVCVQTVSQYDRRTDVCARECQVNATCRVKSSQPITQPAHEIFIAKQIWGNQKSEVSSPARLKDLCSSSMQ